SILFETPPNFDVVKELINSLLATLPLWILFVSIAISLLIQYCLISYGFGGFAKSRLRQLK
ncbi:hypothetical protein, partial [Acinetobacter faecalis]|uniref:hypothetical protein n=1 Tax=Acinetobacter faecalis TaxID=2665161 RepID=UPI002A910064